MTNPAPAAISSVTPINLQPWCGRTRRGLRLISASHAEGGELCILNGDDRSEHDYPLGDEFFSYLKDSFGTLYGEGESHPSMMTVGLHARLLGRPDRIGSLHKFLDYLQHHQKVWICRRDDLAKYSQNIIQTRCWVRQISPKA